MMEFHDHGWVREEVRKERLRRILTGDFLEFCRYFHGDGFVLNSHHEDIASVLTDIVAYRIGNCVINLPPRYGKTQLCVIYYIAWCLAKNPGSRFIHLSYSEKLALKNSSDCRELILSDKFQELWSINIKDDENSKELWTTSAGGGVYATRSGGAVTGFGAGVTNGGVDKFWGAIILDDPHKVDDVMSKLERDAVNERLNGTIKSRRNSRHVPIIIVMQRLHEEDMSGFVLSGGMGEKFYHLKVPAIKPDGSALWELKHTLAELEVERLADALTFSGQMMQEPSPEDGTFFKKEWFKRYRFGEEPVHLSKYGASDYAVSEGKGDYTEQGVCGFDSKENLWLLDWWSGRTAPDVWIGEQFNLYRRHEPILWAAEGGVIRRSIEPFLSKSMRDDSCYFRMEWINSNKDKAAKARAFQSLASQGKVYIPLCGWGDELIMQLLQFPTGKHDDKVDVCGLFGRILNSTYGARDIIAEKHDKKEDFDYWKLFETEETHNWKLN